MTRMRRHSKILMSTTGLQLAAVDISYTWHDTGPRLHVWIPMTTRLRSQRMEEGFDDTTTRFDTWQASCNGNTLSITGSLWGEYIGHRTEEQTVKLIVVIKEIWDAMTRMRRHSKILMSITGLQLAAVDINYTWHDTGPRLHVWIPMTTRLRSQRMEEGFDDTKTRFDTWRVSCNGNTLSITGSLWGESIAHRLP